jgi:hypothetical protein
MNLRDTILNIDDRSTQLVNVPEWGVDIYIRSLSGTDREQFIERSNGLDSEVDKNSLLLTTIICDENNKQLFTEADVPALSGKDSGVLDRLVRLALEINGLGSDSLEDAVKN